MITTNSIFNILEKLNKSDYLQKDVGRITFPKIDPKLTNVVPAESVPKQPLQKGQNGDWKNEGYSFTHDKDGKGWRTIAARTRKGEVALGKSGEPLIAMFFYAQRKSQYYPPNTAKHTRTAYIKGKLYTDAKDGYLKLPGEGWTIKGELTWITPQELENIDKEEEIAGWSRSAVRTLDGIEAYAYVYQKDVPKDAKPAHEWHETTLTKSKKEDMSQVVSVAVMHGDKILMAKRNDNGKWTLPGGHMYKGETPKAGAMRELFEEAGIKPKNIHYLGNDTITHKGEKKKIHAFVCFGKYSTSAENDPDKEVSKWQWIDCSNGLLPDHVKSNLHSPKNVVLAKIGLLKGDKLEKGAAKKLAPFDPYKDGDSQGMDTAANWVSGNDPKVRENLPQMTGSARFRGLNKLRAATQYRKNPTTGEIEYLLHRGMSGNELDAHQSGTNQSKTSWTPHKKVAIEFSKHADDKSKHGAVVSAWIPEKHIHSMPYMLSSDPYIAGYRDEHEVIVNPHKMNMASSIPTKKAVVEHGNQRLTEMMSLKDTKALAGGQGVKNKIQTNMRAKEEPKPKR